MSEIDTRTGAGGELVTQPAPADEMGAMMRLAVEQGESGVAALERIVAMRERAEDRAAEQAFAAALANFQCSQPSIGYNADGAHNARYATLDHIMDRIRPSLAKHGLSVTFDSEATAADSDANDGGINITCIVRHACGHSERASFFTPREKTSNRMNNTQREGSAMSYGRRYALCLALGLTTGDVDDDAQMAGAAEPITESQLADLDAGLDRIQATAGDRAAFLAWLGVESLVELPSNKYQRAMISLKKKAEAAK